MIRIISKCLLYNLSGFLEDIRKTPFIAGGKSPAAVKGAYQMIFLPKRILALLPVKEKF